MIKSLLAVFRQKKKIAIILLFLLAMGIFAPHTTLAAKSWLGWGAGWAACVSSLLGCVFGAGKGAESVGDTLSDPAAAIGSALIKFILIIFAIIILVPTGLFSFIGGTLLVWVLNITTGGVSYTSLNQNINPVVAIGWPIVRDLGNMIIVVGLIIIALATILRFRNYEAKQLLAKLIIAALLINFSLVMCGLVIDAANITMLQFLPSSNKAGPSWLSLHEYETVEGLFKTGSQDTILIFAVKILGTAFFFVMRGITSFLFTFLFLFRVIALWVLVLLSPLAIASYVLPQTKSLIFDKWISNFLQWCFIGVFGAIFLNLGTKIHHAMINTPITGFLAPNIIIGRNETLVEGLTGLLGFFVPGVFMIIGFIFSLQLSAMGATAVAQFGKKAGMGAAKFTGKIAGGTGEGIGNYFGKKVGLLKEGETVTRKAKDLWGQGTEWVGRATGGIIGRKEGATLLAKRSELTKAKQSIAVYNDDPKKLAEIAQREVTSFTPKEERLKISAAAEMLASQKKFDMIPKDKQEKIAAQAVKDGAKKEAFTVAQPELLAVTDQQAKQSLIEKEKARLEELYMKPVTAGGKGLSKEYAVASVRNDEYADVNAYKNRLNKYKRPEFESDSVDLEIATEKQALGTAKVRERTLGYEPVSDQEAKNKIIDDKVKERMATKNLVTNTSVREDFERELMANGLNPEQREVAMARKTNEMRKEFENIPLSTGEIFKAKTDILEERGTPEAAGKNESEIIKLMAVNPDMTRKEASQRLINNAYANYRVNTEDASDAEVIEEIKKGKAKGAKFLKEALKRDILHTIKKTDRAAALANANNYGERTEEFESRDYRYAPYNKKRMERLRMATPGRTPIEYQEMAIAEKLSEAMPKMSDDQLRNIDPTDITNPKAYESIKKLAPEKVKAFETAESTIRRAIRSHISAVRAEGLALEAEIAAEKSGANDKNKIAVLNKKRNELIKTIEALRKVPT